MKVHKKNYKRTTLLITYTNKQSGFKLPSELIPNRTAKFIAKLEASDCV